MALGIDCTAQKGALYAGGSSIAVLGSGIDVCYPKENRKLMEKISQVGAVITEFPPHTPPTGSNFPKRNRIISALSLATVVVEADKNSGALITANRAKEQGRMLFAYPGSVNEYRNEGANMLLQEGARVATNAIDILEQFLDRYADIINLTASKEKPVINKVKKVASNYDAEGFYRSAEKASMIDESALKKFDSSALTEEQLIIYNGMEYNKTYTMDELLNLGSTPDEIASTVMMLQLAGAIENVPGGYYIKK
jgi:DNA processing protein